MRNATAVLDVKRTGNLDTSTAQAMTVDGAGMAIVLRMLSTLYSNPSLAVVREYACNARDSHVQAGKGHIPIDVSLPTPLDPQLKVRDYGLGLSGDEIMNVYARYGASTKRNSDEQIGAFGIGAKSAFAVGNQFTVTGVKDGEKNIALFSLDESGRPTVQILFTGPTDEPNGVLVDIGVDNVNAVYSAAQSLFFTWPQGSVLVDGEKPQSMWSACEKLADNVYLNWADVGLADKITLVMGGVPYRLPDALIPEFSYEHRELISTLRSTKARYFFFANIGDVDITPSREELKTSERTINTLTRLLHAASTNMGPWIEKQIQSAANLWEASRVYRELVTKLNYPVPVAVVKWHGHPLGREIVQLDYPTFTTKMARRSGYGILSPWESQNVHVEPKYAISIMTDEVKIKKTLFVTDVPADKHTVVKTYAKEYLCAEDNDFTEVVASPETFEEHGWFSYGKGSPSSISTMSYESYRSTGLTARKARLGVSSGKSRTKYSVTLPDQTYRTDLTAAEIKSLGLKVAYYTERYGGPADSPLLADLRESKRWVFVAVTGSKSPKVFLRVIPDAVTVDELRRQAAQAVVDSMTAKDLLLLDKHVNKGSDYDVGLKWVDEHRASITNQDLLKRVDAAMVATRALTDAQVNRINLIISAYATLVKSLPSTTRVSDKEWFHQNLPFLALTLSNIYVADRMFGDKARRNQILIDYVNSTTVSPV